MAILKPLQHKARASMQIYLVADFFAEARGLASLCSLLEACLGATGAAREEVGSDVANKQCGFSYQGGSLLGSLCYQNTSVSPPEPPEKKPQQ